MNNRNVDERVVEMRFDNAEFESGVKKTLGTLDELDKKLKFEGSDEGIKKIAGQAKNFNLDAMGKAADAITSKFSALEAVGLSAIATLTSSATHAAINFGKHVFDKYFIKPVSDGFQEYELLQNTIQTIYTNTKDKGTTIEEIEKGLDDLNKYADETIYVMSDMTRAIGQFTNAGISFDRSKTAVKGFANLAAAVGATNAQLVRVQQQSAEAMNNGYFILRDWVSIQNSPLGGQYFQKALLKNAGEAGEIISKAIEAGELSFRQSFDQTMSPNPYWLTSEAFIKTLEDFANDPELFEAATAVRTFTKLRETLEEAAGSGWAATWKIIVGDFGESKALWTDVSKSLSLIIDGVGDARNSILQFWKDAGGRTALINALSNAMEALLRILKPIREAFDEAISPYLERFLVSISEHIESLTGKMLIGEKTASGIKMVFKLLFNIIKFGLGILKQGAFLFDNLGFHISKVVGNVFEFIGGFNDVGDAVKSAWTKIKNFFSGKINIKPLNKAHQEVFEAVESIENLSKKSSLLSDAYNNFKSLGKKMIEFFAGLKTNDKVVSLIDGLKTFFKSIPSKAVSTFNNIKGFFSGLRESQEFQSVIDSLKNLFSVIWDFTKKVGSDALDIFNSFISNLNDPDKKAERMQALADSINAIADALKTVAGWTSGALSEITSFFKSLSGNVSKEETTEIENTADAITDVSTAIDAVKKSSKAGPSVGAGGFMKAAIGLSLRDVQQENTTASKIVESTRKVYQDFYNAHARNPKKDQQSLFSSWFDTDNATLKKIATGGGILGALGLFVTGYISVLRLMKSARKVNEGIVSKIFTPIEKVLKGGLDIFGLRAFSEAIKTKSKAQNFRDFAIGIGIIVSSIAALAMAVDDPKKLWHAVGAVGAVVAVMTGITILLGKLKLSNLDATSKTFVSLGAGVAMIVGSIALIAHMLETVEDPNNLIKSAVIVGIITALVGTIGILSNLGNKLEKVGKNEKVASLLNNSYKEFIALAASVYIISMAMAKLANIDPNRFDQATAVVFGFLTMTFFILSVGANKFQGMMNSEKIFTAIANVVKSFAVAILLISFAVSSFSKLSIAELGKGMLGLIGVVAILTAAMTFLSTRKGINTSAIGRFEKIGIAFVLMALAIDMMVPALAGLTLLAKFSPDGLIIAALSLAVVIGAISVALSHIDPKDALKNAGAIVIFAAAVGILGRALVRIGTNAEESGKGLLILLGAVGIFVASSLILLIPTVRENLIAFSAAFVIFAAGVYILAKAAGAFAKAVYKFAKALEKLAKLTDKNLDAVKNNIIHFIDNSYDIFVSLAGAAVAGSKAFADAWDEIWAYLGPIITKFFNSLGSSIETAAFPLGGKLGNALGGIIISALQKFTRYLSDKAEPIIGTLTASLFLIGRYLTVAISSFLSMFGDGPIISTVRGWVDSIADGFKSAIDELTDYDYDGAANKIKQGGDTIAGALSDSANNINTAFALKHPDIQSINLLPMSPELTITPAEPIVDFSNTQTQAETFASGLPGLIAPILIENASDAEPGGEAIGTSTKAGADATVPLFGGTAQNIVNTLAVNLGGNHNRQRLYDIGYSLVSEIFKGANAAGGIESPSKEAIWTASMINEGFTRTLTASIPEARVTGYVYASSLLDGIKDASSESLTYTPSITPVIRSGNIVKQAQEVNGLFRANQAMSIATTAKLASQDAITMRKAADDMRAARGYDDSRVVSGLGDLNNNTKRLASSLANMGVYIDGKKAGKVLTPTVNRELYNVSVRKGRNN